MADKHFIAINFHDFHNEDAALKCAHSVRISANNLTHLEPKNIHIVFFNHSKQALSVEFSKALSSLDIISEHASCATNGAGLNIQIRKALDTGFDFLYRVDADDNVFPNRFKDQISFMANTSADFAGGALLYQNMITNDSYHVTPRKTPKAIDYIFNNLVLHPTLAMRLTSVKNSKLLYWNNRIEDKEFMLSAIKAKKITLNDEKVYGTYNYNPAARSSHSFAILNLKLNIRFIAATRTWHLAPVALFIYGLSCLVPINTLRTVRYTFLHRKNYSSNLR